MKKSIVRISSIVIIIIGCFIISFIIGLNIFKSSTKEYENFQNDNSQTNEINSLESMPENCDTEATKKQYFEGIITEIDIEKKQIAVENPSHLVHLEAYHGDREWRNKQQIIIEDKIYLRAVYLLSLNNVPIKDFNGNKIEVQNLKVGDAVNVSTRNVEYVQKIIFEALTSDNIVLIERKKY